uniref:Uncharacterized protein n=1 Tax=viral metagenome TaxID=1070528 RepID=A0A6C0KDI4_9ZZZZ
MDVKTRLFLFIFACIPLRLGIMAYAKNAKPKELSVLGKVGALLGLSFLYLWVARVRETATEAGGPVWWKHARPVHAALWLAFAKAATNGHRWAWKYLLADVALGLGLWVASPSSSLNSL